MRLAYCVSFLLFLSQVAAAQAVDDEVWHLAPSAGGYMQRDPDNGAAMTEQTRIQVAYDERYLYVAVLCEDASPAGIAAALGRREDFGATDYVGIGFDPRHDHRCLARKNGRCLHRRYRSTCGGTRTVPC